MPLSMLNFDRTIRQRFFSIWQRSHRRETGHGIARPETAIGLAKYFREVIATDASERQIGNAEPRPNILYRVAPAEASGLADRSVDLVTVAQALHWFDCPAFFAETNRVLRPGGIIAVWAYTLLKVAPEIDALVDRFYYVTTEPCWPPERKIVEDRYRGIAFPFHELTPPSFQLEENWSLDQLLGYLRTWSATQRFIKERGFDPVSELERELVPKWGERTLARPIVGRCIYASEFETTKLSRHPNIAKRSRGIPRSYLLR